MAAIAVSRCFYMPGLRMLLQGFSDKEADLASANSAGPPCYKLAFEQSESIMAEQKKPHLPIGYWLKKADEVITARVNLAQESNGLSRVEWQLLNILHESGSASWEQVQVPLGPFVDRPELEQVIVVLTERKLLRGDGSVDNAFHLTERGVDVHQAALSSQKVVRQKALEGVSDAEYMTAVGVLQRMVDNLSDDSAG